MPSVFKQVFKQSFAYAVGTILNRVTNIILLPLYVRYLSKAEYGVLEILLLTSTVTMIILQLGMGSALFRSVLYKEGGDRQTISSTAHYFLGIFSLAVITILMLLSPELASSLFDSRDSAHLLRIIFLGDLFLIAATVPMSLLRIDQKTGLFVKLSAANFLAGITLNLLFLVHWKMGVTGIVWANTLTSAVFAALYLFVNRKEWRPVFSMMELRDMLGFGLPLVPSAIGDLVLQASDRYIIKYSRGFEELGAYSVAMRLAMAISLVINAFQMAWPAIFFPMVKNPEAKPLFARLFNYLMFLLVFATLALSIFSREIVSVLATANYLDAASILPLICLSFIFYGIYYYSSIGIQVEKKNHYSAIILICAAVLNVMLNLAVIPRWGLTGAGFAKLASNIFLGITVAAVSQRYYAIPYQYKALLKLALAAAATYLLSQLVSGFYIISYIERLLLLAAFPAVLWMIKFFRDDEMAAARRWLSSIRKGNAHA
jgi:O-antigen/teichoic acid export membrane protein